MRRGLRGLGARSRDRPRESENSPRGLGGVEGQQPGVGSPCVQARADSVGPCILLKGQVVFVPFRLSVEGHGFVPSSASLGLFNVFLIRVPAITAFLALRS